MRSRILAKTYALFVRRPYRTMLRAAGQVHVPDPYESIQVDPHKIRFRRRYVLRYDNRLLAAGTARSGDWDFCVEPFAEYEEVVGLRQRFIDGLDWQDTEYVAAFRRNIQYTDQIYGCLTEQELLDHRCPFLDALYHDMRQNGYRSDDRSVIRDSLRERLDRHDGLREVLVLIGRSGDLICYSGKHRLALAQILQISTIPVQVLVRHHDWQRLRSRMRGFNSMEDVPIELRHFADHPDMESVVRF